jgi:hypothetical protein
VTGASRFLKDGGYTNVIVEVANEMNGGEYSVHPLISTPEGMASLIDLARSESGGLPTGCSGTGGYLAKEVCQSSDVVLFHGNSQTRQRIYKMINQAREWAPGKPLVCNEDSQAIGNMATAMENGASWGYYNNMTKQEPPTDWSVTAGEDRFFAHRMAQAIGIAVDPIPEQEQYYLQGLEPHMILSDLAWIRVASLYPETIDRVDFYRNGKLFYRTYDEPFSVNFENNWKQNAVRGVSRDKQWRAEIHLSDGRVIERAVDL